MTTKNASGIIRLILVSLAVLPVYLYVIIEKVNGQTHYSVSDLLGWQLLIISAGLLWLLTIHKYILKSKIRDLSPGAGALLLDISVGFLLIVSVYLLETAGRLTYYHWFTSTAPDRSELIRSLRTIAANPFYSIVWLGPVTILGQLFLELSRTVFLKNFWDSINHPFWNWLVILLFAILLCLLNIDRGWTGMIGGFSIALLFNIAYYKYRRLFPLLLAGILFQYLNMIGLWLN
ncbi:MAG: hypothetical protein GXO77_08650 [Calditrichaeota bacterium]|nr:hypothetical protein [Calditrichota bacterium]